VTAAPQAGGVGNVAPPVAKSAEPERRSFDNRQSQGVPTATVTAPSPTPAPAPPAAALADAQRAASPSIRMRADTSKALLNEVVVTGVATASTPAAAPPRVAPLRIVRADTLAATVRTRFEVRPGVEVILTETSAPLLAPSAGTAQRQAAEPLSKTTPQERSAKAPALSANTARVDSITWVSAVSGKSYVLTGALTKEQLTLLRSRLPQNVR
jgi:hypothetical protein